MDPVSRPFGRAVQRGRTLVGPVILGNAIGAGLFVLPGLLADAGPAGWTAPPLASVLLGLVVARRGA